MFRLFFSFFRSFAAGGRNLTSVILMYIKKANFLKEDLRDYDSGQ